MALRAVHHPWFKHPLQAGCPNSMEPRWQQFCLRSLLARGRPGAMGRPALIHLRKAWSIRGQDMFQHTVLQQGMFSERFEWSCLRSKVVYVKSLQAVRFRTEEEANRQIERRRTRRKTRPGSREEGSLKAFSFSGAH